MREGDKKEKVTMSQNPTKRNDQLSLRISSEEKSLLMRASVLQNTSLTEFVTNTAVSAALKVIEQSERIELSEKDSLLFLNMLEHPPVPNEKLMAAAFRMPPIYN